MKVAVREITGRRRAIDARVAAAWTVHNALVNEPVVELRLVVVE